jgi:outer membrane protein assembly factor BamB/PKD repeat protein
MRRVIILMFFCLIVPGIPASDVMFRSDPQHTGIYSAGSDQPDNVLKWSFDQLNNPITAAAAADGVVYFGSSDHNLYALFAANGSEKWRYTAGGMIGSAPAVSGGVVYFGSGDGVIYAVNAADGSTRWQVPAGSATGSGIGTSAPAVSGGTVYIASHDGNLYALVASTGAIKWRFPFTAAGNEPGSSPAVDGDSVYFGDINKKVYAVYTANGTRKWEYTGPYTISSSPMGDPAVHDGVVYMGGPGPRNMTALFSENGTVRYRLSLGYANWELRSPAIADDILYTGGADTNLYALDAATGTQIWSFPLGSLLRGSPSVADGIVYASSMGKVLYAIYAENGTEKWRFSPPNNRGLWGSPVIADGIVYIDGDGADHFYAVGNGTPAQNFEGRVLAGETGNVSARGLRNAAVFLYGSSTADMPGTLITTTVTDSYGYFLLPVPHAPYQYFSLVHEDTIPGSSPAGAWSPGGTVKNTSWVQYQAPLAGKNLTANYFWDFVPVVHGDFLAGPLAGKAPLTVYFTDNSTGYPTNWNWVMEYNTTTGNGLITNLTPVCSYTYAQPGLYSVQMRVSNAVSYEWVTRVNYINVTSGPAVISLPGNADPPTDPDGDGIYEDLNANGRLDFADVVLYFNQMTWIGANEPIAAFDLNGNSRIDFADIVALFNEI